MKFDLALITNVGENLYGSEKIETVRLSNGKVTPTVIQDFSGMIKSICKKNSQVVVTEHESVDEAIKFLTDSFGVTIPIVKFLKGTVVTNGNGNAKT